VLEHHQSVALYPSEAVPGQLVLVVPSLLKVAKALGYHRADQ